MTDQDDIRKAIHEVRTLRRQFVAALDGIEARLNAMAGPEASFQIPDDWSRYLERNVGSGSRRTSKEKAGFPRDVANPVPSIPCGRRIERPQDAGGAGK